MTIDSFLGWLAIDTLQDGNISNILQFYRTFGHRLNTIENRSGTLWNTIKSAERKIVLEQFIIQPLVVNINS